MKTKSFVWLISSAIALGLFIAGSLLRRVGNIFIYVASGYMKSGGDRVSTVLMILFTLIVHVFFSFLTVWLVAKYAKKHDRLEMRVFLVPAAVILLFFSVEVFVGLTPGILSILAHEAGLLFFGFLTIRRASNG